MYTDFDGIQDLTMTRRYRLTDEILREGTFRIGQMETMNVPTPYAVAPEDRPTNPEAIAVEEPTVEAADAEPTEPTEIAREAVARSPLLSQNDWLDATMTVNGQEFPFGRVRHVTTQPEPTWMRQNDAPRGFERDYLRAWRTEEDTPAPDAVWPGTIGAESIRTGNIHTGTIRAEDILTTSRYNEDSYAYPFFSSPRERYRDKLRDLVVKQTKEEKSVSLLNLLLLEKKNEASVLALFKQNSGKVTFA